MSEKEWEGNQPKLLLKALIAHGPKVVPRDLLIEEIWPKHPDAEKSFKINLHRLRKALEPTLGQAFGSSCVHLKGGLVSLDRELCRVDVDDFLSLLKEGEKKEEQGEEKEAQALFNQALQLYGGDFLAEEFYLPWVEVKRTELKGKLLAVLYRLAARHEKHGALTKASDCYLKVLATDPLSEPAYQKLMLLYSRRGMRSAALQVYDKCRRTLKEGLDAEPDGATTAIYQKIL